MDSFTGFGPKALAFFEALKFHQSKPWFEENRDLYESDVIAPMVALLDDLTAAFAARKVPLKAEGKRSIFRLHRDVRFARDKSPYKTHAGAVMTRSGGKKEPGLLYIHIAPDGCFTAAGFHRPEAAVLARLRAAIKAKPQGFAAIEKKLDKAGLAFSDYDRLTRLPRGFEDFRDSPHAGFFKMKSFLVREPLAQEIVTTPEVKEAILDFAGRALPLLRFGWKALG